MIVLVMRIPYWRVVRGMHLYFHSKEISVYDSERDAPNKEHFFSMQVY